MKKLLAIASLLPQVASAATGYYLVSVYDVAGQASIDYKYWNAHYRDRRTAMPEIGFGYGVTDRWYTEVYGSWIQFNGERTRYVGTSWQNDIMLTQGQYDIDAALHTLVERGKERGYSVEIGPVLQTQVWRTQINFNVFLQRQFDTGTVSETELVYQWQVKQRWKPWLQPGVQGFGEVGKWNGWKGVHEQSHRVGPALFGTVDIGRQQIKYEAAYLLGKNSDRRAKSFTMRVQYIF
jgi:hypothetical protein